MTNVPMCRILVSTGQPTATVPPVPRRGRAPALRVGTWGLVLEILRLCLRMTMLGPVLACKIGLPRTEGMPDPIARQARHPCPSPPPQRRGMAPAVITGCEPDSAKPHRSERLLSRGPLTYGANRLTCVSCLSDTVREFQGTQLTFRIMDFLRTSIRHHLFSGECDPALGKSILQARQTNRKSIFERR